MHGAERLESTELALKCGLRHDQIIISCKTSRPRDLITVYRDLSAKTEQPLHLGLTEAGMGMKGQIWSAAALGVLLHQGIGDTIRISLTPKPGGDRREEVYAACEVLQALGLRSFSPSVTACPGCGRTTSSTFQELAERIQGYIRDMMPIWKTQYEGVETMTLAVMGCIVNGPGESKAANIGISLPGTGEAPRCPVYIDGKKDVTLEGTYDELAAAFQSLVDGYIASTTDERLRKSRGVETAEASRRDDGRGVPGRLSNSCWSIRRRATRTRKRNRCGVCSVGGLVGRLQRVAEGNEGKFPRFDHLADPPRRSRLIQSSFFPQSTIRLDLRDIWSARPNRRPRDIQTRRIYRVEQERVQRNRETRLRNLEDYG